MFETLQYLWIRIFWIRRNCLDVFKPAALPKTNANYVLNINMYMKLDIPKVKREPFANRSFSVKGPRMWNNIPKEATQCVDVETFQKKLRAFLLISFKWT